MKIGGYKRIVVEDYDSKYQDLIGKLGFVVNSSFDTIFQALTRNLSINDNLNQYLTSFDVKVSANGIPINKTQVKTNLKGSCVGIICVKAINQTNSSSYPSSSPLISFSQVDSSIISIDHITGLSANQTYTLTVILLGS